MDYVGRLDDEKKDSIPSNFCCFREGNQRKASEHNRTRIGIPRFRTENLKASTEQLKLAWAPTGEKFSNTVATAGKEGNSVYTSQSAGVQEIINGMDVIADEVGTGKSPTLTRKEHHTR